jgi:hypothetical protein
MPPDREAAAFPDFSTGQGGSVAARAALGRYLRKLRKSRRVPVAAAASAAGPVAGSTSASGAGGAGPWRTLTDAGAQRNGTSGGECH